MFFALSSNKVYDSDRFNFETKIILYSGINTSTGKFKIQLNLHITQYGYAKFTIFVDAHRTVSPFSED